MLPVRADTKRVCVRVEEEDLQRDIRKNFPLLMKVFGRRHRDQAEITSAILEGLWDFRRLYGGNKSKHLLFRVVLRRVIDRLREIGYAPRPHVKWAGGGAHGDALNFVKRIPDYPDQPYTRHDAVGYEDLIQSISKIIDLSPEDVNVLKSYDPNLLHMRHRRARREQQRESYVLWNIRKRAARHRADLMKLFGSEGGPHE